MTKQDLTNLIAFMRRVPVTGEEALAWAQTYTAVQQELAALDAPPAPPAPPAA